MEIVICCKPVPELRQNQEGEVNIMINPSDMAALGAALQVKGERQIEILSMCSKESGKILKKMYGFGVSKVTVLCDIQFAGSDTYATSYILSSYIKKLECCKLVLCGTESMDGGTGHICPSIGEHLGIPHITNVIKIKSMSESYIYCLRKVEGKILEIKQKFPVVISILSDINQECQPVIGEMAGSIEKDIRYLNRIDLKIKSESCGRKGSYTNVLKLEQAEYEKRAVFVNGSDEEQTDFLIGQVETILGRKV